MCVYSGARKRGYKKRGFDRARIVGQQRLGSETSIISNILKNDFFKIKIKTYVYRAELGTAW